MTEGADQSRWRARLAQANYALDWDARPRLRIYSAQLELKRQDCWIGVFWKQGFTWDKRDPEQNQSLWATHIWVCVLPMLPLHIVVAHEPPLSNG
jgi:hypothetical protein